MKKRKILTRPLAALLALVMALTMTPVAAAAAAVQARCPACGQTGYCTMTVVKEANCHETGVERYVCTRQSCNAQGQPQLIETQVNTGNHDFIYTDNLDGTHSGACRYDDTVMGPEAHTNFYNAKGVCEKCGALNYSQVSMNLPETRTALAALGDPNAKLTAGEVKLTLGTANVTADYELSYLWFYQNKQVGEGAEYPLPSSVYSKTGIYYYTLIVSAVPKGTLSRQPVTRTCNITLQVDELITASAIVSTQDAALRLGDSDGWSAEPVSSQIYAQVLSVCGRNASPSHVVFGQQPEEGPGKLKNVTNTSAQFYFGGTGNLLDNVEFVPGDTAGEFTVSFTAFDTAGERYAGMLTITVQQYTGDMDVVYATARNTAVTLDARDFQAFWSRVSSGGTLDYITFDQLPTTIEGAMYIGYASQTVPGEQLWLNDLLYVNPGVGQFGINSVAFVPGVTQNNYVTLGFTAHGSRGGRTVSRQGVLYIFLNASGRSADFTVSAGAGEAALTAADFQKAYQAATGTAGTNFYIQLVETPASGSLYVGRTAARPGTLLTDATINGRAFSCGTGVGETVSSLTYVPGAAASESVRYVASSAQGDFLYAGKITFTSSGTGTGTPVPTSLVVKYDSAAAGVAFKSSSFETLPGASAAKLSLVSFTPPAAASGTLYYGRTATAAGTAITSNSSWFSVSSTAITGANSMNNVTFVPAAGSKGVVTIPFTALDTNGARVTGTVQITITASTAVNPGTTTRPIKTFPDVPATEWYYTYVTDLATNGILGGYEDGTFRPSEGVSLGQALKMIMIAAGYPDISGTGSNWARPFLDQAKADNLLPAGVSEDLNRLVSRYVIAEIAAKAMKLMPVTVTVSPFSDMKPTDTSAPYVMALYNTRIIEGSEDAATKTMVYMGTMGIRRREFAAIIWRMMNYVQTGNVTGTIG